MLFRRQPAAPRRDRAASLALAGLITIAQIGALMVAGSRLASTPAALPPTRASSHTESITYIQDLRPEFFSAGRSPAVPDREVDDIVAFAGDTTTGGEPIPQSEDAGQTIDPKAQHDRLPLAAIFDRPCVGPACLSRRKVVVPALPQRRALADRQFRDSVWRAFREDFPRLAAKQLPPTQEETDRMWRAKSLAASEKVGPAQVQPLGVVSIPVGLPFGGPSKEERERAAALHRDNLARLARIDSAGQARADSLNRLRLPPCRLTLAAHVPIDSTAALLEAAGCDR